MDQPPPRITEDPSLEKQPNFDTPAFDAFFTTYSGTRDEGIRLLTEGWLAQHNLNVAAWEAQTAADNERLRAEDEARELAAADARRAQEKEAEAERLAAEKKKPKPPTFEEGKAPPRTPHVQYSPYAREKMKDFKFIDLHHFHPDITSKAHASAKDSDRTFSLSKGEDGQVSLVSAGRTHFGSVIKDYDLTFEQMSVSKRELISFAMLAWVLSRKYNRRRDAARQRIASASPQHAGGRIWFEGATLPDDTIEEFVEDFAFPIADLSSSSARSPEDALYTYCFADIDNLSNQLGYIWNAEKDHPFGFVCPYAGFEWNLTLRTVSIPAAKREKYLAAIAQWRETRTHNLSQTQKLYGKLLHTCTVVQCGRAYLTNLEAFLSRGYHSPHALLTPPTGTPDDLVWWHNRLSSPQLCTRPIPAPVEVLDVGAYSDASSGFGVAIVIAGRWRAWRLKPGWAAQGRNIQWAEAVGFELLVRAVIAAGPQQQHFKVFGDNNGVVEGWRKFSSHSPAVNRVFRRLHPVLDESKFVAHARYVSGKENPADGPSRGRYPPSRLLLPPVTVPPELQPFLIENPHLEPGQQLPPASLEQKQFAAEERERRTEFNMRFEREGRDLWSDERLWWDEDIPYC